MVGAFGTDPKFSPPDNPHQLLYGGLGATPKRLEARIKPSIGVLLNVLCALSYIRNSDTHDLQTSGIRGLRSQTLWCP